MLNLFRCLIDIVIMVLIYMIFLYKRWKLKGRFTLFINSIMYLYIGLVLYVTLMPIIVKLPLILNNILDYPIQSINLLPFDDYINGRGDTVRQIILNLIMMMPFGFLMPIVKKSKLFICMAQTFLFSLGIELFQPLVFRSGDITDIITNTIGGIIGYLLYLVLKPNVDAFLLRFK